MVDYIDAFDRASLSYYSLQTSSYSLDTTYSTSGDRSLTTNNTNYDTIQANEGGGLPRYPKPGDTFSFDIRGIGSWGIEFDFARTSSTNRVGLDISFNENYILQFYGGSQSTLTWQSQTLADNTWYTVSVDWNTDGTVAYRIYEQDGTLVTARGGNFAATPSSTGTFAFVESIGASGGRVWVDSIRLGDGPLPDEPTEPEPEPEPEPDPGTLSWDTQSDWDSAQSRARVVTRGVGIRVPDQIWQGYDPHHPIADDAVAYWPLDESIPYDEIGQATGSRNGPTTGQTGILSSRAYLFDGIDDSITVNSMPLANPGSSWTVNLWVRLTSRSDYRLYFSVEDSVAGESLGIGNWNNGDVKIYSAGRTPGDGSAMPLNEWTMMTLRWNASTQTASLFKNGSFDYSVQPSGGGSPISDANQITIGNRRVGNEASTAGRLNEILLFDRALSDAEIAGLYDTIESGTLTTATKPDDAAALELTTTANVPTGTTASITVNQYDGTTTNTETVTLANGTDTHSLTQFESLAGADYWLTINQSTTNKEATAKIDSVDLSVDETTPTPPPVSETLSWDTQSDWDGARRRERVVTRSIGDRNGEDIALGYDPQHPPVASYDCYWTYDENSGTLYDVISGRNGTKSGATAGVEGVLGSTAVSFDGVGDYVSLSNHAKFNDVLEMTWAMWIKTTANATSGYNSLIGKGDLSGTGSFLIELDDDLLTLYVGNYSTYDEADPITITDDEWHHIAVEWDKDTGARFYFDGSPHGSGSGTAVSMPNTSAPVTIGADLPYESYFEGAIDEPMYWRDEDPNIGSAPLYDAAHSGYLTTAARSSDRSARELTATANIPAGTSVTATVYQESIGDGSASNQETVTLADGEGTYELTSFDSEPGATYWIEFDLATTDRTKTPTVSAASLDTSELSRVFVSTVRLDGWMVDIPVYDLSDVERDCVRMRDRMTGEVGAANIIDPTEATAIVRHPVDGKLGLETEGERVDDTPPIRTGYGNAYGNGEYGGDDGSDGYGDTYGRNEGGYGR